MSQPSDGERKVTRPASVDDLTLLLLLGALQEEGVDYVLIA